VTAIHWWIKFARVCDGLAFSNCVETDRGLSLWKQVGRLPCLRRTIPVSNYFFPPALGYVRGNVAFLTAPYRRRLIDYGRNRLSTNRDELIRSGPVRELAAANNVCRAVCRHCAIANELWPHLSQSVGVRSWLARWPRVRSGLHASRPQLLNVLDSSVLVERPATVGHSQQKCVTHGTIAEAGFFYGYFVAKKSPALQQRRENRQFQSHFIARDQLATSLTGIGVILRGWAMRTTHFFEGLVPPFFSPKWHQCRQCFL